MIKNIKIQNYKSILDAELELKNLNVLIGPNASGKTNFLQLFALLRFASVGQLAETISTQGGKLGLKHLESSSGVYLELTFDKTGDFKRENADVSFSIKIDFDSLGNPRIIHEHVEKEALPGYDKPLYLMNRDNKGNVFFRNVKHVEKDYVSGELSPSEELTVDEQVKEKIDNAELAIYQFKDFSSYPTPYKVLNQFQGFAYYRPVYTGPESPMRQGQTVLPDKTLRNDGSNLYSILNNMHPDVRDDFEEYLRAAFKEFKTITTPSDLAAGKLALYWFEKPFTDALYATQLSDGAIRLIFLLALLLSPSTSKLICIEEPEIGLHPESIKILGSVLKKITYSGEKQIIVATHSSLLISEMDVENIVVVEKKDGATTFRRLSSDMLSKWIKEYSLGQLWVDGHLEG